jgi:O-Antigen ligase
MNPSSPEERAKTIVRALIWTYFGLLIIEGALRKWVVPGLSNPLLVVRDPVALLIYFFSLRARVFPRGPWFVILVVLGIICSICTFVTLDPYLPTKQIALVCGYGIHSNFFHLPLIFVMGKVMNLEDVKRFGWWTLILIIPMTFLMIAQFRASPDALINSTAGGEGEMMQTALGKVRTAGPFSFVIGVVLYFALATSFLMWGILKKGVYKNWLLVSSGIALLIGTAVSGSRSAVASCALVIAFLIFVFIYRRDAVTRVGQILLAVVVVGFVVSRTPIFKEGLNVMTTRFNEVAEQTNESVARGIVGRVFSELTDAAYVWTKSPWWGYGLGIGTNAGANILTGHSVFLLTEGEWSRIELESGRVLGVIYIFWRVALVAYVFVLCIRALKLGNLLPLFLFAAGFVSIFNGQFGQPTILGFAVITFGLTLAAMNSPETDLPTPEEAVPVRRVTRRSVYAARLHDPAPDSPASNGSSHL